MSYKHLEKNRILSNFMSTNYIGKHGTVVSVLG